MASKRRRTRDAFWRVKDQVMMHTSRVLMNASDPIILYSDASTTRWKREALCFVSHTLSEQATRWGGSWSKNCSHRFCVKSLSPYLQDKLFTVRTDHKNFVYLSNSTVPKLVRWRSCSRKSIFKLNTSRQPRMSKPMDSQGSST